MPTKKICRTNAREVRLTIGPYAGTERLDIRHFVAKGKVFIPTPKGINIPADEAHTLIRAVRRLVRDAGLD